MERINAIITGVGGYVPEYVLNNEELSRMVDTNDEWIMSRVGIKERRILNEEGLGTSYMARKAAKQLLQKTGVDPDTIDALSLLRFLVCPRCGSLDDTVWPIQEDYCDWCR